MSSAALAMDLYIDEAQFLGPSSVDQGGLRPLTHFQIGWEHYIASRFEEAFEAFETAAAIPNEEAPVATHNMAVMLERGEGCIQDDDKARDLYEVAAEQGVAEAKYGIGLMLHRGAGGRRDKEKALKYFEAGAALNHPKCLRVLGLLLIKEETDIREGLRLLNKAAGQNYAHALIALGNIYKRGEIVRKDAGKAEELFRRAAEQKAPLAMALLGSLYKQHQHYAEAIIWLEKGANAGSPHAQSLLGTMYATGQGVEPDYMKALALLQLAAFQEDANAINTIGLFYAHGVVVPQDFERAQTIYEIALAKGADADAAAKNISDLAVLKASQHDFLDKNQEVTLKESEKSPTGGAERQGAMDGPQALQDFFTSAANLPALIVAIRKQAGLSQIELAEKMGTTQRVISRLENGHTTPNLNTLKKVAEATNTELQIGFSAPN